MASVSFGRSEINGHDDRKEVDAPEVMTTEVDPSSVTASRESSELPIDMAEWSPDEVAAYTALRSKRKKCCIGGCTHRSIPIARSYHQLPVRNKDVWVKWIQVIRWSRNEPDWSPNGDAAPLVCSRHFLDTDFISYEASSRVRLSHTAIPVYYVEPLEGTVMDARFSNPPPIPPMLVPRNKETTPKNKKKIHAQEYQGEEELNGHKIKKMALATSSPHYGDNLGYDIEEVMEENCDGSADDEHFEDAVASNQFPYMSINAFVSSVGNNNSSSPNHNTLYTTAAQSQSFSTTSHPKSRNLKYANSVSKPPALIRANFFPLKDNLPLQSHSPKLLERGGANVNVGNNKVKFGLPVPINLMKQKSSPTKHKIGLAKCRLIVQTLENQLKIAKTRLAEQLEIPYQVVHGVWNMRDSLKDKL